MKRGKMLNYFTNHVEKFYTSVHDGLPGLKICTNKRGWDDYYFGRHLLFSHRVNIYGDSTFPDKLHTHDFFEMDIFYGGQVSYVLSDHEVVPRKGDILLIPPGGLHTGRLMEKSEFDRAVFYFEPQVFAFLDQCGLPPLFQKASASYLTIDNSARADYHYLLQKLEAVCAQAEPSAGLLGFSYIIQLFHLIGARARLDHEHLSALPSNVLEIKRYIDENFQTLASSAEISAHFFYSREYISRMFKQYFNTNISEYIAQKRISAAKDALEAGQSVTQAFNASGYRSMSSFISAFRSETGLPPSLYRKKVLQGR